MGDVPSSPSPSPSGTRRGVHLVCLALLACLFAYVLVARWVRPLFLDEKIDVEATLVERIDPRIDPNTATWGELAARLPGIGEVRANEIVTYREGRRAELGADDGTPVFRVPDDLQAVRGIGPKTVELIAPHLRFPEDVDTGAGRDLE